ncbi:nucleoside hydrolase [Actinocorallia libanotica]|uniref:Pyrimidine-specific ribonucleoside hydrolase RihA n=1 Tax=Actinocorallia libanotica TaxID=46162 RepID=A0ABP4BD12_9ACTN
MLDLCFDLETQDPDDVLTLCLTARHPRVRLRAVTVTPGSDGQVGLVRHVLRLLGRDDVPVGARDPATGKEYVSGFHRRWLGGWPPARPDGDVPEVLLPVLAAHPRAVLLTGGPLRNLRLLLECGRPVRLARWVAQGGFAGDPLVPPERRLAKFDGLTACPTFNFNGEPQAALSALSDAAPIARRELVSKNVTHGVRYDRAFHERLEPHRDATPGLALIWRGMDLYLRRRPGGKLLHDPTAACAAIDPSIAVWAEAEITREPGGWAARPQPGTRTFITTGLDHDALFAVFAEGRG